MKTESAQTFERGARYRVIRDGYYLRGMKPVGPGVETLWRRDLRVGDIITCAGGAFTAGDGVPIIRWQDADGTPLANDCEFQPDDGRMWGSLPADGFLVRVDSCRA